MLWSVWAFWRFSRDPGLGPVDAFSGVAVGAAVATKSTAMFFLPILALFAGVLVVARRP